MYNRQPEKQNVCDENYRVASVQFLTLDQSALPEMKEQQQWLCWPFSAITYHLNLIPM